MHFKRKKAAIEDKPVVVNVERKEALIVSCSSINRCADYIIMESELNQKLNKMRVEKEVAIAQKEAYIRLLDKLCPDWRLKATVK